ncbi:SAGA-associated factor 11-like isoform X1 [Lycium barbarum]|uniref:SAGA-associated factor 11-like isoform X1 n=1 Tax=Lycium barbarum TaxID=112863 RepID=UPI00293EEB09|nr:SAGA-associated factor 11-like isoform X1 [Lycium barbarum]
MSAPNEDNVSQPQHDEVCIHPTFAKPPLVRLHWLSLHVFDELLDSIIIDVASECHRVAKLGLDRNLEEEEEELRLSAQARASVADPSNSSETNGKYIVDIFGQTHPPVATEIFECMNCGRSIMAGRFAPHLEKCMGKGRKARLKATRSSTAQNRYTRASSASTNSPYSNPTSTSRQPNGSSGVAGHEYSNGSLEEL